MEKTEQCSIISTLQKGMSWLEYTARIGIREMRTHIWSVNFKAKDKLGDVNLNEMIISRWNSQH
jgi:hypothetical protein